MKKEKVEGVVTEVLPDTTFKVRLDDGREIFAYLSGKMRINFIKIVVGDIVEVELSPYDKTKGRIVRRK
jgi:translation initiation factor IF-1